MKPGACAGFYATGPASGSRKVAMQPRVPARSASAMVPSHKRTRLETKDPRELARESLEVHPFRNG